MLGFIGQFRWKRWAGIALALAVITVLSYITFTNAIVAILKNSPFWGLILTIIFIACLAMTYINFAFASYVDPGPLPPWLAKNRIESFAKEVLIGVIESEERHAKRSKTNSPQPQSALASNSNTMPDNNNTKQSYLLSNSSNNNTNDEHVNANAALSAALAERLTTANSSSLRNDTSYATSASLTHESHVDDTESSLYAVIGANNNTTTDNNNNNLLTADDIVNDDRRLPMHFPTRMNERRRRKEQLGLEVLSVSQLAHNALAGLNGDRASVEREMEFLLRGSALCHFCDVYKLQETHHCSTCERCIFEMDHHCSYFGQCVGVANQKYYLLFLIYTTLSCVIGGVSCVIAVSSHYAFFYTARENNSFFFLAFAFVAAFAMVLIPFTAQAFLTLGRGETTLAQINREDRELTEHYARRITRSGIYRPLFAEDAPPAPRRFVWGNLRHAFGEGSLVEWLLPIPARRASAETQEARFWSTIRVLIEHQLHAAADVANGTHHSVNVNVAVGNEDNDTNYHNNNNNNVDHDNNITRTRSDETSKQILTNSSNNSAFVQLHSNPMLKENTNYEYENLHKYNEPTHAISLSEFHNELRTNTNANAENNNNNNDKNDNDDSNNNKHVVANNTSYNLIRGARSLDPAGPLSRIIPHTTSKMSENNNEHIETDD